MASKITISLVLGCALLGGYASMFTSYRYGYFDALRVCTSNATSSSEGPCVLDMSDSVTRSITGNPHVDDPINVLLEFFSQGLRPSPDVKGIDLEALLGFVYLAAQFGGAWYIIALEGLRLGNKGTILSWTGTFGLIFQGATITIIAPIYLALQLIRSPSTPQPNALLVHPRDLSLLPLSSTITYIIPTIGLCFPLLNLIAGEARLLAIALWQPFPLYHTAIRGLTRILCGATSGGATKTASINVRDYRKALSRANKFITVLTAGVHLAVVATALASVYTDLVSQVSGHHILALTSLTEPPTLAMLHPPVSITDSREIVVSFLRWDVYCTCASMVIWSAYQLSTIRGSPGAITIVVKILLYALLGGPIFPALMLLWQRDEIVASTLEKAAVQGSKGNGYNGSALKGKGKAKA